MAELEAFDFILFGGGGDLAMRKLLPALYYRHRDEPSDSRIISTGRQAMTREEYVEFALGHCRKYIPARDFNEKAWAAFAQKLDYLSLDAIKDED